MKKILPLFIVPAALVQLAPLHAQLSGNSLSIGSGNGFDDVNGYYGAIGSGNTTSFGTASLQIGNFNYLADSDGVLSVGESNHGSAASLSAIIGRGNFTGCSTSAVIGSFNTGWPSDSLIVGSYNSANGETMIVAGQNNDISSAYYSAFAFGIGLAASWPNAALTLLGRYNNTDVVTNSLFVIGNGSDSSNRRNAFEVFQNGDIKIPGGKLSIFATPSSTSGIVLDPVLSQITVGNRLVLTSVSDGSVGIGTTTPLAKLHVANNGYALFGPNSTWGQSLRIGGNGNVTSDASVVTTDGNLHLDSAPSNAMYLNYYKGTGGVNFGGGQGGTTGIVGSVSAEGNLTMNGKSILKNNVKIFGSSEAWAEGLTVIQSSGWGGVRLTRNDPATGNYEGNWAIGYTGYTGNDFSISTSFNGAQYDGAFHISNATRNVGIGTTNPLNKLQVNLATTGGISLGAYNSATAPGVIRFVGTTGGDGTWNGGNISGGDNGSAGMAIINTSAGAGNSQDVAFYTHLNGVQSSQKLLIKSDGTITMTKRQGDIAMGEFGNGNGD